MARQSEIEITPESGAVCVNEHARRCVDLRLALANKDEETVRKLINPETREDAEEEEAAEGSPLWVACEVGFLSVLPDLWRTSPEHSRIRSLYAAVQSDNPKIVEKILELSKGEECLFSKKLASSPDEDGNNPLHIAAKKGNWLIMAMLLKEFPELVLTVNKQRRNVLHIAVENRQMDVVNHLLEVRQWEYLARASDKNSQTFLHDVKQLSFQDIAEVRQIFEETPQQAAKDEIKEIENLYLEKEKDIIIQDIKKSMAWISVTAVLLASISYQGVLSGITAAEKGPALRDNKHFKNFVFYNSFALSLSLLVVVSVTYVVTSTSYHPGYTYTTGLGLFIPRMSMDCFNLIIVVGVLSVFSAYVEGLKALSLLHDKMAFFLAIASFVCMPVMTSIPYYFRNPTVTSTDRLCKSALDILRMDKYAPIKKAGFKSACIQLLLTFGPAVPFVVFILLI